MHTDTAHHSTPTELPSLWKKVLQVSTALSLCIVISGFIPCLIQLYAWYDMAQKKGSVENIITVVTEDAPCSLCRAAMKLNQEQEHPDSEKEQTTTRLSLIGCSSVFFSRNDIHAPTASSRHISGLSLRAESSLRPASISFSPATPPPQLIVRS